jgi:hypothetical protein
MTYSIEEILLHPGRRESKSSATNDACPSPPDETHVTQHISRPMLSGLDSAHDLLIPLQILI